MSSADCMRVTGADLHLMCTGRSWWDGLQSLVVGWIPGREDSPSRRDPYPITCCLTTRFLLLPLHGPHHPLPYPCSYPTTSHTEPLPQHAIKPNSRYHKTKPNYTSNPVLVDSTIGLDGQDLHLMPKDSPVVNWIWPSYTNMTIQLHIFI